MSARRYMIMRLSDGFCCGLSHIHQRPDAVFPAALTVLTVSLSDWLANRWIVAHEPNAQEIANLFGIRRLWRGHDVSAA